LTEQKHVFSSHGLACDASLLLPDAERPPVIVMAHGFAAERSFGTGSTVAAFVAAGFAVFSFDYRCFGQSEGSPRQLVDPTHHCQDWYNAIQYLRSLQTIDPARIVLWGSSFSGGHVLATAARDHQVRAVIALVPHCDGRSTARRLPLRRKLAGLGHALLDLLLAPLGRVHEVAVVGDAGDGFAMLDWPGWKSDYLRLAQQSQSWRNAMPARSILRAGSYHPADNADAIECPVLVISGKRDQGVPREDILALIDKLRQPNHLELDFDHFDLYEGWPLNRTAIDAELDFLRRVLA
jgi:fermentation-respiration switch protein FrsA (DUF1100 family)